MSEYKQARRGRVTTPLGEDVLLLRGFRGTEAISTPFRFELDLMAVNAEKVAFESLLGERMTVHLPLPDGGEQPVNGVCVRFVKAGRDATFTAYRAEIVPALALLGMRRRSRIFQRKSVPDVLKKVFETLKVSWKLAGTYEPREYVTQYRESDLAFASRLMEEEGIFYFFRHADGEHELVVGDSVSAHPDVPGEATLLFDELSGGTREDDCVFRWEKSQELRPSRVTLWDHSFQLPHKHLEAEQMCLDSVPVGEETHPLKLPATAGLEVYDWPGGYAHRYDAVGPTGGPQDDRLGRVFSDNQRTSRIRMDEVTAEAVSIRGESNAKRLASGHRFRLSRHPGGDGPYVVASVTHEGRFGGDYRAEGGEEPRYRSSFRCFPEGLPFRPPRITPRPTVLGCQTAVVTGPAGEEIGCDPYGRVQVQLHWDREGPEGGGATSCWLRVATPWAGSGFGAQFVPRIGTEVLVDFLEGDPDKPVVVGCLYNPAKMPPFALPGQKTVSGIRTRSSLGGGEGNFNEISFEDAKGSEVLRVQAERDLSLFVKRNEGRQILQDRWAIVGRDDGTTVMGNSARTVWKNSDHKVLGSETRFVRTARFSVVTGPENEIVTGGRAASILNNDNLAVVGSKTTAVTGPLSTTARTITLTAPEKIEIGLGPLAGVGAGPGADEVPSVVLSPGKLELRCGEASIVLTKDSVTLESAAGKLVLNDQGVGAKAATVYVESEGDIEMQGSVVKMNT